MNRYIDQSTEFSNGQGSGQIISQILNVFIEQRFRILSFLVVYVYNIIYNHDIYPDAYTSNYRSVAF